MIMVGINIIRDMSGQGTVQYRGGGPKKIKCDGPLNERKWVTFIDYK
jgi:hypothetical protein